MNVAHNARLLGRLYHTTMQSHPFSTKLMTGAAIFGIGDVGAQTLVEGTDVGAVNWSRTARGAAFGAGFSGWLHVWWRFLESHAQRFIPVETHGRVKNVLYKLAWDQLFSAVLFNVGYVGFLSLAEGQNLTQCGERVQKQVPGQMILHWQFWPIFHFFNFMYIPLDYRVVTMNVVKVFWSGLMSYRIQGRYVPSHQDVGSSEQDSQIQS